MRKKQIAKISVAAAIAIALILLGLSPNYSKSTHTGILTEIRYFQNHDYMHLTVDDFTVSATPSELKVYGKFWKKLSVDDLEIGQTVQIKTPWTIILEPPHCSISKITILTPSSP